MLLCCLLRNSLKHLSSDIAFDNNTLIFYIGHLLSEGPRAGYNSAAFDTVDHTDLNEDLPLIVQCNKLLSSTLLCQKLDLKIMDLQRWNPYCTSNVWPICDSRFKLPPLPLNKKSVC